MTKLKEIEKLFTQGKITRRDFLTQASAIGIGAVMLPTLLTTPAIASSPVKGGRFRQALGSGSTTDTLDPATYMDDYVFSLGWQIRNNLVEVDHKGNAIPELAESFEAMSGGAKWIFKLRKGVEFHNGKTMDTEDVIYSINHHRGEDSKSGAKSYLQPVVDIKAEDKYTVVFTLDSANADFPFILTDYHFNICQAGTKGNEWDKGMGTGGYILEEWEPGVRALTKRNPNYWKQGRAHFDEVETLSIQDTNARTTALKSKKVDFMNKADLKTIGLLGKVPGIQVVRATGSRQNEFVMLVDNPPYDNNDVRLALKYAVDREQIVKMVLRGYGQVGNDHPIAPFQRYHATKDELPQRKYDPDKAKYHMKKAGLQGHTFKLHAAEFGIESATLFKEQAKKAGINIELVREPDDGYWTNVWIKKPFCTSYYNGRPTEDMAFTTEYGANSAWNDTRWKDEKFNKLLLDARAELDAKKRREMYVEMQRILNGNGGAIIYNFKDHVEAASDKIEFKNLAGNLPSDGLRAAERWWFKG